MLAVFLVLAICVLGGLAMQDREAANEACVWERVIEHAAFAPSYNYPVHVAPDGRFVALHPQGTWESSDGRLWTASELPGSGLNSAYLAYVLHEGATWALGTLVGNSLRFTVEPVIRRTTEYRRWEVVGRSETLPQRIFYAAVSFRGALWMLGGYDGARETAEVWNSTDGMTWHLVSANAPWSPRAGAAAVVFRDRLYLIAGGQIDGPSFNDVWSTSDGMTWKQESPKVAAGSLGIPVVFRDRLWLVGANTDDSFGSATLVSRDGKAWAAGSAPWPPRGAAAVWTTGDTLFMTGGKYSSVERGETVFTYYNDVWRMRPVSGGRER